MKLGNVLVRWLARVICWWRPSWFWRRTDDFPDFCEQLLEAGAGSAGGGFSPVHPGCWRRAGNDSCFGEHL